MSIGYSSQVADFDANPANGLERKNNYLVANISPENINDNNLIEFLLPGGSNQGVLYAGENTGNWIFEILENKTKFTGSGEYLGVGGDNTFYLYTPENQQMGLGFAQATAAGDLTGHLDFNNVEVVSPIPEPAVLTSILLGAGALLAGRRIFGQEPA